MITIDRPGLRAGIDGILNRRPMVGCAFGIGTGRILFSRAAGRYSGEIDTQPAYFADRWSPDDRPWARRLSHGPTCCR